MAGLLGSLIAGGAKNYAENRAADIRRDEARNEAFNLQLALQDASMEKELKLKQAGVEIQEKAEIKKEGRIRETNIKDMQTINQNAEQSLANDALGGLGKAGIGGSVDAESLQALKDNPNALAAYRKAGATGLLNSTRQQDAEEKSNAALDVGRADIADKYESVAKGERADAKEEARQTESNKRLDNQEKAADQRFKAQMASQERLANAQLASAGRAEANALKREEHADVRSKVNALSESLKSYQETGEKASLQLYKEEVTNSPELTKHYTKIAEESMKKATAVADRLENYATTGTFEVKTVEPNRNDPFNIMPTLNKQSVKPPVKPPIKPSTRGTNADW